MRNVSATAAILASRPARFVSTYIIAVVSSSAVMAILLWARPEVEMTVPLAFLTAVIVTAWYGGFGPGLLATFISTLMIHFLFLGNRPQDREAVELVEFVIAGLVATTLTWQLQRSLKLAQREHATYVDLVEDLEAIVWEARGAGDKLEFTYINRRIEALLGIRADQWRADSTLFTRHFAPDDLSRLLRLCSTGGAEEFELTIPASEGRPVWFRIQVRAARNGGCTLRGIMVDITESKRIATTLEDSERRFRHLAENARDIVFRYRLEPRGFDYISPASTSILGYTPEEHYADPDLGFRIIHPDDRPVLEALFLAEAEAKQPVAVRWRRKDGAWVWTETFVRFVRNEYGKTIALEGMSRDVTERKRFEDLQDLAIQVAASANEATRLDAAAQRCLEIICRREGWDLGLAWLSGEGEKFLQCAAEYLKDPQASPLRDESRKHRFARGVGLVGQAWAADAPLWIPDLPSYAPFKRPDAARQSGIVSALAFPVRFGPALVGVFEFFSRQRRDPDRLAVEGFDRLGVHLGIIFERKRAEEHRTRLLLRERAAREEAEASQRRMAFLAEASALLDASLDYNRTLSQVAKLAVARLADWCVVHVLREDGSLERVALTHTDPAQLARAEKFQEEFPPDPEASRGVQHVARTGRPELYSEITEELLQSVAKNPRHLQALRELGLVSVMIVPLRVRQTILGTITLASTTPSRRYGPSDLDTAEALALRAAQAIQNSRLYREAQEAIRTREEFLSIAAHELKTPLTTLQLQLQNLMRKGEFKFEAMETARRQGDRLAALIGNLLDVSRITAGRMELEPETMDLVVAIQAVVERLGEQFRRSGSTVTIQAPPSAVGRWDRLRIEQVIINLLSNAIKYGQGKPIAVTIEVDPARARLIVQDQGIGIPPDAIGRLFAPFERAVSSRHYSGLGLGLYIVHQIIEAHGGSIRVHSRLGSGSTFTVELPRQENARAD